MEESVLKHATMAVAVSSSVEQFHGKFDVKANSSQIECPRRAEGSSIRAAADFLEHTIRMYHCSIVGKGAQPRKELVTHERTNLSLLIHFEFFGL